MLENFEGKVLKLISLYEAEKQRADTLCQALESKEKEIRSCKMQITDLNQQIDNLRLAIAFQAVSEDKSGARARIDSIIREIDRCIKLLEA